MRLCGEHPRQHCELSSGPVELIRLTDLGTDSVRRRLLAEGRDAPLIGELAQASPTGLLGVLADHYDPESARAELAAWIAVHGDRSAALEQLVCAVRTMPFRTRAEAMLDVLVSSLDDGKLMLRSLRSDPSLAHTVLSLLARREILTLFPGTTVDHRGPVRILHGVPRRDAREPVAIRAAAQLVAGSTLITRHCGCRKPHPWLWGSKPRIVAWLCSPSL
nr:hypothetical protein OG781_40350 [Streptomyces sp. NBC_00830]